MKKVQFFLAMFFVITLSEYSLSQTVHIIEVRNNFFTPAEPTVEVGDTVRWVNIEGTHNVVADDNSFTSGSPSSGNWVYDHVFTSPGINPYYCSLHGAPGGIGMAALIMVVQSTDVQENEFNINSFQLQQNYPNPFNPSTSIQYTLGNRQFVLLKIYNILGDEVATLVNEEKEQGVYDVTFDATGLSSGMYLYKLQAGSFVEMKKMIIIK